MLTHKAVTSTLWLLWAGVMSAALAALIAFSGNGPAQALEAEVKIADLDCGGTPEVVEIENEGPDAQDLAGWRLLSDPITAESFDLTALGSLPPGASVFVESGPAAEATFKWSTNQVFRDRDSTDFVRLVDDTGLTRAETACAAQATGTATPSPRPTLVPSPTATTAPAVNVPNGGGAPGDVEDLTSSPLAVMAAGGSLVGLGALVSVGAWLSASGGRKRGERPAQAPTKALPPAIATPVRRYSRASVDASRPLLLALTLAILGAIVVALVSHASSGNIRK